MTTKKICQLYQRYTILLVSVSQLVIVCFALRWIPFLAERIASIESQQDPTKAFLSNCVEKSWIMNNCRTSCLNWASGKQSLLISAWEQNQRQIPQFFCQKYVFLLYIIWGRLGVWHDGVCLCVTLGAVFDAENSISGIQTAAKNRATVFYSRKLRSVFSLSLQGNIYKICT